MFDSKVTRTEAIVIPERIAKKLSLRDGMIVEAKVEKGKLLILGRKNKIKNIMKYAGIWKGEDVDRIFREIRKDWHKWQTSLSA
ncbi:MAG: AbrB/MazE/SpoVT family DNA-binding domain-containing protein [Deltaproteobacteria bacterium]|nr:AbrB/MazE/SpoVT family DNA-binding domain-containing protein [Deltaproteobacteria bacterium]